MSTSGFSFLVHPDIEMGAIRALLIPAEYIVDFICGCFPSKNPFKRIAKILADSVRHELVHGFGLRSSTAKFKVGLYVSDDPSRLFEVHRKRGRDILAVNSVAFASAVLAAFGELRENLARNPDVVSRIIEGSRVKFTTPTGVANEFKAIRERFVALPSNRRMEPTRVGS